MSYIDTFDHEYLGHLGYLPIYHPLVCIEQGDINDFACSPDTLVLGGGSGEHPGLVISEPGCAVARFLLEQLSDSPEPEPACTAIEWLQDMLVDTPVPMTFHGWSVRDMAELLQMADSNLNATPLRNDQSVEDWLLTSIGEFVYYSLPDVNPLPAWVLDVFRPIAKPIMNNVRCPPPGYPRRFGRKTTNNELQWGYSRW
ncbi:hypothetical protein [Chitinilyticum litopenaei]|uniref:hypothetical protein n=1 Tax=Chitinilyticum litopenaei TaxID=1121276 RepID=UPI00041DE356|nr:hypothetical protein [Chitinilyticum litopenaei]